MAITHRVSTLALLTFCAITARVTGQAPINACDLIKASDLAPVAGKTKISISVPTKPNALGIVTCDHQWGPGNNAASGRYTLDILLADTARLWPGIGQGTLRMMVGPAKPGTSGDIAGVGDASLWQSMSATELKTITLIKEKSLVITLEGRDLEQKKDGLIELTKLAASRVQK